MRDTTLKGLDEALNDLQRAIEGLPDTSTKKGLIKRYGKLQEVRDDLSHPHPHGSPWLPMAIGAILALVAVIALFLALRHPTRPTDCRG